jgi:ATPase subunit of ABC transporter with duplicated ATPase domains
MDRTDVTKKLISVQVKEGMKWAAVAEKIGESKTRTAGIEFFATDRRTKHLVADHIARRFGERRLIDDMSLVLSPGTRLGLPRSNGSGKSTLLRLSGRWTMPVIGPSLFAQSRCIPALYQHLAVGYRSPAAA